MNNALKIALGVAAISSVTASMAFAGLNPTATARLYWLTSNTVASTNRNSLAVTASALVAVKGVTSFRGGDVQLLVNGLDGVLPDAWRVDAAGCNNPNYTPKAGGSAACATTFRNIWSACTSPTQTAVPGVATSQDGSMRFADPVNCLTPHGVGLIWLSAAGSAGVARVGTTEYGLFGFKLLLSATGCAGDLDDPAGPHGVCINPNYRIPCNDVARGGVVAIVDANAAKDFAPFDNGFLYLTWAGQTSGPYAVGNCNGVTPVKGTSWGTLKRLYH